MITGWPAKLKHFDIVMVVTDGHDLFARVAAVAAQRARAWPFGAAGVQNVDHGKIAHRIFGAEDGDAVAEANGIEGAQGLGHAGGGAAEHGLDGVGGEGVFEGMTNSM